ARRLRCSSAWEIYAPVRPDGYFLWRISISTSAPSGMSSGSAGCSAPFLYFARIARPATAERADVSVEDEGDPVVTADVDEITRAPEVTSPVRSRAMLASASASEFNSRRTCSMAK